MLTGMLPISSGDALIKGRSVKDDMRSIRSELGGTRVSFLFFFKIAMSLLRPCAVCPQHDILYDMLTVEEHLRMFAALKGMKPETIDEAVTAMIASVGLSKSFVPWCWFNGEV